MAHAAVRIMHCCAEVDSGPLGAIFGIAARKPQASHTPIVVIPAKAGIQLMPCRP